MAIQEVRVQAIDPTLDIKGNQIKNQVQQLADVPGLTGVRTSKLYLLEGVDEQEAGMLSAKVLANPVFERATINAPILEGTPARVTRITYLDRMTDPAEQSIIYSGQLRGVDIQRAATGLEIGFYGDLSPEDLKRLEEFERRHLFGETIQETNASVPDTLIISGETPQEMVFPISNLTLEQLTQISVEHSLYLEPKEMEAIQNYFAALGREPTYAELQDFGARWSEHCVHKTFKAVVEVDGQEKKPLFTRLKEHSQVFFEKVGVISAYEDNSGIIRAYNGKAVNAKGETHNSPLNEEPGNGTGTGVGGLQRDVDESGESAEPILTRDHYLMAPIDTPEEDIPPGALLPRTLLTGAVRGARDYGNPMGIPTVNGSVHFDKDFRGKSGVLVVGYGVIPESRAKKGIALPGDAAVVIGGPTGRDGINGATFSSVEKHAGTSKKHAGAVQIGNPIEQRKVFDLMKEARDMNFIRATTDLGAAGLSSAFGEMGMDCGGVRLDISNAKLKEQGLAPWEIWVSESQERVAVAIDPNNLERFLSLCKKYKVEPSVLGEFTDSGKLEVYHGDQRIVDLDYDFVKNGMVQRRMVAKWERPANPETMPSLPTDWEGTIKAILSHPNVASRESITRQYDHGVQAMNVLAPFTGPNLDGPNDAVVLNPDGEWGMVASYGMNPTINKIDPYNGAIWACVESVANFVSVGGNPDRAAWVNNYITGKPEDPKVMGALDEMVDGVCDSIDALGIPVISGKDSLSSTYRYPDGSLLHCPPTLCMSTFGCIPDVEKTTSVDIKRSGSTLVMVGQQDVEMGGSIYWDINGQLGNEIPKIDLQQVPDVFRSVYKAINEGAVLSCHDVSLGGLMAAVTQMSIGGDCGVELDIDPNKRPDLFLFNETPGVFVIEVEDEETAKRMFGEVPHQIIGKTTADRQIRANVGEEQLFNIPMEELRSIWKAPMEEIFR